MMYTFWFKVSIVVFFSIASLILLIFYYRKISFSTSRAAITLCVLLGITAAVRIMYLREIFAEVDTSTWLSSVIAFKHYPSKLWLLLNYTDSRPLTVLPLIVANWLGVPISYNGSEIVGLWLWIFCIGMLYYICVLLSSETISLIIIWSLCLCVSTFWYGYAVYNSEHVSILMITIAMFGYIGYIYYKWSTGVISLCLGMLLGALIYAKFQNAPMGLVTGLFLLTEMAKRKDWRLSAWLITGSILPTFLMNIYYGLSGKLEVFWNNYFWNNFYYSYTLQFSNVTLADRFSIGRIYHFILYAGNMGYYLITLSIILGLGIVVNGRELLTNATKMRKIFVFTGTILLSSIYAVLQSGNDFQHYKLYIIIPYLLLAAILIIISPPRFQKYMVLLLIVGSIIQTARNVKDLTPITTDPFLIALDERIISKITSNSLPSTPIVIWGWRDHVYVKSKRAMGYRDSHTFHFSLKSPLIPFWTKDFLEDMQANKPEIFIDAAIPKYSERGDKLLSFDEVPVINAYVNSHYRLLEEFDGVRIFKRR